MDSPARARARARSSLLLFPVFLLFASCGGGPDLRGEFLQAVRRYHEDLRWARYNDATLTLAPDLKKEFLSRAHDAEDKLTISEWELFSADVEPKGKKKAVVQVRISWMRTDETILRSTTLEQKWERRRDVWYVMSEKRLRGPEFPLELPYRMRARDVTIDDVLEKSGKKSTVPITRQNNEPN